MRSLAHRLDSVRRLVIPAEIRRRIGLEPGTALEFFVDGDSVVLHPYRPGCAVCGVALTDFKRYRFHQTWDDMPSL